MLGITPLDAAELEDVPGHGQHLAGHCLKSDGPGRLDLTYWWARTVVTNFAQSSIKAPDVHESRKPAMPATISAMLTIRVIVSASPIKNTAAINVQAAPTPVQTG